MHRSEVQTRMEQIYEISGPDNILGGRKAFEPHALPISLGGFACRRYL